MGFKYLVREHIEEGMMSLKWNLDVKRLMSCLKGGKHVQIGGGKKSHVALSVVRKGRRCCQFVLRLKKGRDID
jgi:hypothetical protein